jgi:neuropathy target esterase sws
VNEFSDVYEMTLFVGTNPTEDSPVPDSWNSVIIPESDLVLFVVEVNNEESVIHKQLERSIDRYSRLVGNAMHEVVFVYHNNQFNPNHTNNLKQNEWQKRLNTFDKSHEDIDFAFSDTSRYYYPNELPLFRLRQQLMRLDPSHFHHILINPAPYSQSVDLRHNSSDVRRLARWLTHTSIGMVFSGGAARGWGHVGVVKAMDELGVPIDMCGGTSAGSLVGAAVALFRGNYELVKEVTRRAAKLSSTPAFYLIDMTLPLLSLVRVLCVYDVDFGNVHERSDDGRVCEQAGGEHVPPVLLSVDGYHRYFCSALETV